MNKKGFTLIELLAVIVILAIIGGIGVVSINGIVNKSKENSLKLQYESIEKTTKTYCQKHLLDEIEPSDICKATGKNCCTKVPGENEVCYIVLGDLIEEKLIDPVKDPKNGGFISEETLIKIEYRNNQFVTEINK